MNARDKVLNGTTAVFESVQKPEKPEPTEREIELSRQALAIFDDCTDDEMAMVLMVCIHSLGHRLAGQAE